MENHPPVTTDERARRSRRAPAAPPDDRTATAFVAGGGLILASLVAPLGLGPFTVRAWAAGLVLAGLAAVALGVGLIGVARGATDQASLVSAPAAIAAGVAGLAGVGLVGLVGIGLATDMAPATAMEPFLVLAATMAAGLAIGFVLVGIATRRSARSVSTSRLFLAGGTVLLVPLAGEVLRFGSAVSPPPWLFLPALVLTAGLAIVAGRRLGRAAGRDPAPAP